MKNKIGVFIVLILIIIFSIFAFKWVKHRLEYAITDAVFVETDNLSNLSFKRVAGKIIKMYKEEGDKVKKGDIIAEIDSKDYKLQLKKIQNEIKSLKFKKLSLQEKLNRITKELEINVNLAKLSLKSNKELERSLNFQIEGINAKILQLENDKKRFEELVKKDLAPKRKLEEIETNLKFLNSKKNSLLSKLQQIKIKEKSLEKNLELAKVKKIQIKELDKNIKSLDEKIKSLKKSEEDIKNLVSYTKLKAPFDGVIAKKFKNLGEIVSTGIPVYAMYPSNNIYINVLLEETKLKGIRIGNKAVIHIDAYPDEYYEGIVYEINPTSAAKFALVPRDITAGEFTKVAQRIPVKIKITKGRIELLKIGLGGEVEIEKK